MAILDGRRAIIDTGSPFDLGRGRATDLLDERWNPPATYVAALDAAEAHLGVEIEWLIGYPTLSRCRVLLDWPGRVVTFSREPISIAGAHRIPIDLGKPVPIVELELAGEIRTAVLDSGAALSYVARDDVAGHAPIRVERDFHPTIGAFDVDVYALSIVVGGQALPLEAGVLPSRLARRLDSSTEGRILGSDFFRDRAIVLDYPDGCVWR